MLSLNSLSENHNAARTPADNKRKAPAHTEERAERQDFGSYLAAMAQPVKPDARPELPAIKMDAPAAEKTQGVKGSISAPAADAAPQVAAQKAGIDSPTEVVLQSAAREPREGAETGEAKLAKVHAPRNEKELLEVLGISAKKTAITPATDVKKAEASRAENPASALKTPHSKVSSTAKNETAAHTLVQLDKIPDLVLSSSDGLKRLGEKLGIAFLSKVSEKLSEKQTRTESSTTQLRADTRAEHVATTTTNRAQKAGGGEGQQGFDAQSNTRSARNFNTRNVSRETLATDTTEKLPVLASSDLKPVSMPDTLTPRNSSFHMEVKPAEAISTTRGADAIRVAVENPAMRADLLRQMSEVMTRAQVLVTDSQNAQFSVKLYPRELGRMEIDLKLIDGEIKGKIVVESEEVKNEMQNFLQNRDNNAAGQDIDFNRIDIEVRSGNQNAQNPERTPDADTLLKNLVTRAAASVYEAADATSPSRNALYA